MFVDFIKNDFFTKKPPHDLSRGGCNHFINDKPEA